MNICQLAIVGLVASASLSATAADPPSLPLFAADPSSSVTWKGLYAGTEAFAIGGSHIKGLVGGGGFIGYDHEFANGVVVGIQAQSGLARGGIGYGGFNGFDYAGGVARVGYDFGRIMPYVFGGADLAKPTFRGTGYAGASDGINGLFSGPGKLSSFTTVGAGVDYKLTDKLTIGFSVGAVQSRGAVGPYGPVAPVVP